MLLQRAVPLAVEEIDGGAEEGPEEKLDPGGEGK